MATLNQILSRTLITTGVGLYLGAIAWGSKICFEIETTDYQEDVVSGKALSDFGWVPFRYVNRVPIRTRPPNTHEAITRIAVLLTIAALVPFIGYLAYEHYRTGEPPGIIPSALSAEELEMLRVRDNEMRRIEHREK